MAHLEIRKFIPASAEAVWSVLEDLEHQKAWMVDVRKLDIVTEAKRGEGVVMRVTSDLFGQPVVKDLMTITGWEPGRRMDVRHGGQFSGTGSFILDRVHNGTILTWIEDFDAPLGPLGEAGFAIAIRPHMLRVFARSLENVRRLAVERELTSPNGVYASS